MNRLFTVIVIATVCLFSAELVAQVGAGRPKNKNTYKKANEQAKKAGEQQAKQAQKKNEQEEKEAEREAAKEEREARRNGEEDGPSIIGGPAEDLPEPGEATDKKTKESVIDGVMDELGITDDKKRAAFKKNVTKAWEDSEKEDKRWAGVYRRYEDDAEKLGKEKTEHAEKLKKIWDESDKDLEKDEVLTEEQMKRWKEASSELRTKTNTDRYYESRPATKEKKENAED